MHILWGFVWDFTLHRPARDYLERKLIDCFREEISEEQNMLGLQFAGASACYSGMHKVFAYSLFDLFFIDLLDSLRTLPQVTVR